jgi:sigma-B regulation protein RsbU (phosphoserine phosphatase)
MSVMQEMCLAVGGDLYHCLPRSGDKRLLVLGDVSGKGMPAALAMSATIGMLRLLAEVGGPLAAVTSQLHRQLWQTLQQRQFVTLFLGELDPASGDLTYANHGQELPILVRSTGRIDKLESTGMPVALFEDLPVETATVHLNPGDLLAVFSDGIPEATRDGTEYFGIEPLEDILRRSRTNPLPAICAEVRAAVSEFVHGRQSSDDITLLLVRRA